MIYRSKRFLGRGGFGCVFSGENTKDHSDIALKVSKNIDNSTSCSIQNEFEVMKILHDEPGFPKAIDVIKENDRDMLVMERLGYSIQHFKKQYKTLSLKTVLLVADQMLQRLEYCFNKGFVHRDIKPSNILVGLNSNSNIFYLIDFGLTTTFRRNEEECDREETVKRAGTCSFSSINSMNGGLPSPIDDLESLAYVFVYLLKGALPWQNNEDDELNSSNRDNVKKSFRKNDTVKTAKMMTTPKMLCADLPIEFEWFLEEIRKLDPQEMTKPDYSRYRRKFRELFVKMNFVYDQRYEWNSINGLQFNFNRKKSYDQIDNREMLLSVRPNKSADQAMIKLNSLQRLIKNNPLAENRMKISDTTKSASIAMFQKRNKK